jgi:hypothetical protein
MNPFSKFCQLTLLVLFFININSFSQNTIIKGKIKDKHSKKPLAYANIMLLNFTHGSTSDSNGNFVLNLNTSELNDTLEISYLSYKKKLIPLKNYNNEDILLQADSIKLSEISVKPSSKENNSRTKTINSFKKNSTFVRYSLEDTASNLFLPSRPFEPISEVLRFPRLNTSKKAYLKDIEIMLYSFGVEASAKLRILYGDSVVGPKYDLIDSNFIIKTHKSKEKIKISIAKYNIRLDSLDIFIGVEYLLIDENIYSSSFNDYKYKLFSPYLAVIPLADENRFWVYSMGRWINKNVKASDYIPGNKFKKLYCVPAISINYVLPD